MAILTMQLSHCCCAIGIDWLQGLNMPPWVHFIFHICCGGNDNENVACCFLFQWGTTIRLQLPFKICHWSIIWHFSKYEPHWIQWLVHAIQNMMIFLCKINLHESTYLFQLTRNQSLIFILFIFLYIYIYIFYKLNIIKCL